MKLMSLVNLINQAFRFVIQTSQEYNIDESHALKHSLEVFNYANNIYDDEVNKFPYLKDQREIISLSAIVHDMCDKKYLDENNGIINIKNHMTGYLPDHELEVVSKIIQTMSYSKVKENGFPDLGEYQHAYHIVREADLLAAYDLDRCIIYRMMRHKYNYTDSLNESKDLFENRILNYRRDNLFVTNYSKNKSALLHKKALVDLEKLDAILKIIH
uniref:HD domain-containing protein n=1 Tax=viral metagenome TaxID=1070528 RepID=A0A6C0DGW6_9ZZZZ